jgi:MFS family permease
MLSSHARRDLILIDAAGFLRSLGIGLIGVVLGIYLFRLGFSSFAIGVTIGVGLAGTAIATLTASLVADRFGRRRFLLLLCLLGATAGLSLAVTRSLPVLLMFAFIGMLNGTGTDRSASYAIEQAVIPGLAPDTRRTWNLAWYNVLLDSGGSIGALAAGLPVILNQRLQISILASYKAIFLAYAALYLLLAVFYSLLSPAVEVGSALPLQSLGQKVAPETKRVVGKLTALFSLDAFGGGFLTDALVSYWFFRRFHIPEQDLGLLFFGVHVLNAGSHLGAAWLARRIGLVNTMVFTHLPSSLFLMAVPFAPSFRWAVVLFLCREALVEMDVPTRQSYVTAMVKPEERTLASGITNLARNVFWAVGSATAGLLMQVFTFSAPLFIGGGAKVTYDVLLYGSFRRLKPPEEKAMPATELSSLERRKR